MTLVSTAAKGGGSSSSGGLALVGATVLGAPAASIAVSAIPATYLGLRVTGVLRSTRASTADRPLWRFNADATVANYMTDEALNNKGAATFSQNTTAAGFDSDGPAASSTAGMFTAFDLTVTGYHSASFLTVFQGTETFYDGTGMLQYTLGGVWLQTTVVTSITVVPTVGPNWATGSYLSVYGLAAS